MNGQIFDIGIIKLMILMVDREHLLRIKFYGIVVFFKLTSLNLYCHDILRSILILFSNEGRKKNYTFSICSFKNCDKFYSRII